jgi:hypothetical protein
MKERTVEEQMPDQLFETGTIASVQHAFRTPDKAFQVVVQAIEGCRIEAWREIMPDLQAHIALAPDTMDADMETQHLSSLQTVHQVPFGVISPLHILWCQPTERTRLGEHPRIKTLFDVYGHRFFPLCRMHGEHRSLPTLYGNRQWSGSLKLCNLVEPGVILPDFFAPSLPDFHGLPWTRGSSSPMDSLPSPSRCAAIGSNAMPTWRPPHYEHSLVNRL